MFKLVTRRRLLAACVLALAFAIGAAGPLGLAAAAPLGSGEVRFFMQATKVRGTALICVGDSVGIDVQVVRAQVTQGVAQNVEAVSGAAITAAVSDRSVGTLAPKQNWTGWRGQKPGSAQFTFSAKRAGTITIAFNGKIHYQKGIFEHFSFSQRNDLVSDTVEVTVQDCAYEVTVTTRWTDPSRKHTALIEQARLTADTPGHYTGTTPVNWIIREAQAVNGCPLHSVIPTSQANLSATLGQDGQELVVTVAYQALPLVWLTYRSDDCTVGSEIDTASTPDQLTFSVGAYGGSGQLPQTLKIPGYGIYTGSADIAVTRVAK